MAEVNYIFTSTGELYIYQLFAFLLAQQICTDTIHTITFWHPLIKFALP